MKKLENQNIICIAGVDFEPLWARTQQLLWRIPESNQILYVEAPLSFLSPFKDPSMWYKWGLWRKGVRKVKDNLYLWSPPLLFPLANRYRIFNRFNQYILAWALKKISYQLGFKDFILLSYLPNSIDLLGKLDEKLLIYDCVDEHSAFLGFDAKLVREMERGLLKKSDLVLVTAQPLYDDKSRFTEKIFILRNAADVAHFATAMDLELAVPGDVADLPAPVLGFIGRIKEWIDLELIKQVAEAKPEWSLVMIGPVEIDVDISEFKKMKNVYFLGSRSKEELPAYLKKFDVCLNPFRNSDLSRAVNPLKFYEYLASGKAIVSTPMPEMDMLEGMVEIGEGRDGFIQAIERALKDSPERQKKRQEFSREHSWEKRVELMEDLIVSALETKA